MTRSDRGFRFVQLASECVREAGFAFAIAGFLLTAATAGGQALRLHTPSQATPTPTSYVVSFDAQGQPYPPTAGTFPASFAAAWQLPSPGSSAPFGLRISPSLRFAWVGGAADDAVVLSIEASAALQGGGFLDGAGGYVAGSPRSVVVAATPTRENRHLLVLDSSAKSAIALVEVGVENGKPTVRSAVVKTGASLPADTFGALGAGITISPDLARGTIVFGDATSTSALLYSPTVSGNRFSSLDAIPNPVGFHYIAATSAGSDGAFWVVGVNGGSYEIRFLDAKTKTWDVPVATVAKAANDVLIPAFDPYDPGRMLLVVSKIGSTPTFVLNGLTRGVSKGTLAPTAQNAAFDFSASPALQPVVLAPVPGAARGYLVGRTNGETSERLYTIDLTTGVLASSSIVFGTARHQTLILERPDLAPQSLSIKADSAGAVSGGQNATFTVTRTDPAAAFVVKYSTQSADGSAVAGRDYEGTGSGTVTMPAGTATAKISIPILAVNGCAPQRTFSVKLTNTDATLTDPKEVQQTIASSTNCTFGVVAPMAAVNAGQPMTFTATRSGTYLVGAQSLPWTAAPGNSATTAADFTPASSTVTLPSGVASASFNVNTTGTTLDCVPEKAVTVTITPQGSASSSATGKIAAINTGCTVAATVTGPEKPFLPADEVEVRLSEVTAGRFDLAQATWTLASLGGTEYEQLLPTAAQPKGSTLRLRFRSATSGSAAGTATGSVKVSYSVPPLSGPSAPPYPATGDVTLDPVGSYPDLVRMDGPANYSSFAGTTRRYSLVWGGGYQYQDGQGGYRKTTWLNPKVGSSEKKTVRWSYWRNGIQSVVTCAHRAGEDCVFSIPSANDVSKVLAEVSTGSNTWKSIAELQVAGVDAPTLPGLETVRYVPVALERNGVKPAFFETELTLVNGTAKTVEAEILWNGITQKEIVGAGRQVVINGLVEALRESSPTLASGGVAPVKVTFRGLASDQDKRLVGVMARTTTAAGAPGIYRRTGHAGLAYGGVPNEELLGNEFGQAKAAWLIGLRGTSDSSAVSVDRTNLAVTKPDPTKPEGVVVLKLYGNDGTLLNTIGPQATVNGFYQWANLASLAGGREVGYARVEWQSGGPVTTYATPLNNASADGSFVFPVREDLNAAKTSALLAPVLFEIPTNVAANQYSFLADAALTSTKGATNTVLDYFWSGGGTGGTTSLTRSIPGQTILGATQTPGVMPLGVVEELRKGTGSPIPARANGQLIIGMGLVRRADNATFVPGELMAGTRVDGPTAGDPDTSKYGRFGIFLPAVPLSDLTDLPELRILGLRQDSWIRSNLALVNPGDQTVALKVELHVTKSDGSAATVPAAGSCSSFPVTGGVVSLPAHTFCQISTVLAGIGATSGYAVVSRTGNDSANPAKPFYAYGVVNDGTNEKPGTNDGSYLLAELTSCSELGISIVDPTAVVNGVFPAATANAAYPESNSLKGGASPTGRNYYFTATGLPPGMSLVNSGGNWYLSGTPTAMGTYFIRVVATDQAGCSSASRSYTITVSACGVTISPKSLTAGPSSGASSFSVTTGSSCRWTAVSGASWIYVTPGTVQTGSSTISFLWTTSTVSSRSGQIDIVPEGQTVPAATFVLTQTVGAISPPVAAAPGEDSSR